MDTQAIDTVTKQAPTRSSRRVTLFSLGAALAAFAVPVATEAKKRKRKKKGKDRCQQQEGQCQAAAAAICEDTINPEACLNGMLPCCENFRTCDADTAFQCLLFPLV